MKQTRLYQKNKPNYSLGPYNKSNSVEQWIRISEGCPHNCPFCYEPQEYKIFGIPEIIRNDVKIMDMNLLAKKEALEIIKELGNKKVNNKVIYYELICGIDYRFLTTPLAKQLKRSRFHNIRIAWDWFMTHQSLIKNGIKKLIGVGYSSRDIMIFMICNWKITYDECCQKLDLCKVWGVKVADCWYDNQTSPNIIPINWTDKQIKEFRKKVRKHNQLINFGIDPEIKAGI